MHHQQQQHLQHQQLQQQKQPSCRGQFEVPVPTLADRPIDGAHCVKCNALADPCSKGVRLNGKSPPTFQCPVCCCKQVGLSKLFVQWPIPGFKGLDEATQTAFWQSAGTDRESLKKAVCVHVTILARSCL